MMMEDVRLGGRKNGIKLTPELCAAMGKDAGSSSMRKAGRPRWNDDDWNAAVQTQARLLKMLGGMYEMIAADMLMNGK
jgi:hypothetical protein